MNFLIVLIGIQEILPSAPCVVVLLATLFGLAQLQPVPLPSPKLMIGLYIWHEKG